MQSASYILFWIAILGWWFLPVLAVLVDHEWWQSYHWQKYAAYVIAVFIVQMLASFLIQMANGINGNLVQSYSEQGLFQILAFFYAAQVGMIVVLVARTLRKA